MVAPAGQFAYQNAYWLPDAVEAQEVILPEHRVEVAHVQHQQQQVVVQAQQAYQNAYWLPDAAEAQEVILLEHRVEVAHVQHQ